MKAVLILNDGPYGSERSYNGLRLAHGLRKNDPEGNVTVFLMGDAVACAKAGQKTPEGFYNIGNMVHRFVNSGGSILLCGTCMDARGLTQEELVEGVYHSTMDALSAAVIEADKVMVF